MSNDGGPAFPGIESDERYDIENGRWVQKIASVGGMSLRDYFAAKAMAGLMSYMKTEHIAEEAYRIADTMLAERAKR